MKWSGVPWWLSGYVNLLPSAHGAPVNKGSHHHGDEEKHPPTPIQFILAVGRGPARDRELPQVQSPIPRTRILPLTTHPLTSPCPIPPFPLLGIHQVSRSTRHTIRLGRSHYLISDDTSLGRTCGLGIVRPPLSAQTNEWLGRWLGVGSHRHTNSMQVDIYAKNTMLDM